MQLHYLVTIATCHSSRKPSTLVLGTHIREIASNAPLFHICNIQWHTEFSEYNFWIKSATGTPENTVYMYRILLIFRGSKFSRIAVLKEFMEKIHAFILPMHVTA